MSLLRRLGPADVRGLDLDALVGPLLEKDGWRVMTLISRLQPDAGTLAKLDARFLRAMGAGSVRSHMVPAWLRWTCRRSWDGAKDFVEAGLQGGSVKTNGALLMAAMGLNPKPDDEWIDWAEQTYEFDVWCVIFDQEKQSPPEISPLIASTRPDYGGRHSPDGSKIVFISSRSGDNEVWICDSDGSNLFQLTSLKRPSTNGPSWSPDGKYIVFDTNSEKKQDIYIVNVEGGNPRRSTCRPTAC